MALQVGDDIGFSRWEWQFERLATAGLTCLLVAAAVGLLGSGPLTRVSSTSDDGDVRVEYDRVAHNRADTEVVVRFSPRSNAAITEIGLSTEFLASAHVEQTMPATSNASASGDAIVYAVACSPAAAGEFRLLLRHQRFGAQPCTVTVKGRSSVSFSQFVLP